MTDRPFLTVITPDEEVGGDALNAVSTYAANSDDPTTLADLLARGIPTGLVAPGIDPDTLHADAHLVTVAAAVAGFGFDAKSGGLKVTFLVPAQHQYLALGLRDAARLQLVLRVYSPSERAKTEFGKSAATTLSAGQQRREQIQAQVREKQLVRRVARMKREWVGPSGPAD